ncbi:MULTISPECIES: hypothetical protein [Enterococcus]|uniref:hypothetical protein n=1 Tax=Enterococcus TaxID=1350 RepID=UPI00045AE025|nr:hypothetical protein [Enterococcus faecalis]KAJ79913.1 hypothetical protein P788_1050 [Enterococcus faecalis MTUP9]
MILGEGHHTQDFSDHTDWIIEELTKDSTRTYFLEINWFDEPTIIDIEMAKK